MEIYNHSNDDQESCYSDNCRGFNLRQILLGLLITAILMASCWLASGQNITDTLKLIEQEDLIYTTIEINGKSAKFLIDTGAQSSVLNLNSITRLKFDYMDQKFDYAGSLSGFRKRFKSYNARNKYGFQFYCMEFNKMPVYFDGIIGGDILNGQGAVINYERGVVVIKRR